MTVATQSNLVVYLGDGVGTVFPFTFPVYDESHIKVYTRDLTTRELTLISDADYGVTGVGNENGGNVTFLVAPVNTVQIIIARLLPFTQDMDVENQGGFYPKNFENELDLLEMQVQQLTEELGRSISGPLADAGTAVAPMAAWPALPAAPERRAKLLAFTDDADAFPTTDSLEIIVDIIQSILSAGFGISITRSGNELIIANTAPGIEQECWLLETGSSGGGGSSGDAEFVRDTIAAALVGIGCVITVDDAADTITIDLTQDATAEVIRDVVGATLVAGTGVTLTVSDVGDTITISVDASATAEVVLDTVGAALVAGPGIVIAIDDPGNKINISSEPNILSIVSNATITPTFAYDQVNVTALAVAANIANPTGTAVDGHGIVLRLKDNGAPRALTWGTKYRAFNDALPSTTVLSKTTYVGIVYNAADDKWDVLGVRQEA
jgi:hypothetical protein